MDLTAMTQRSERFPAQSVLNQISALVGIILSCVYLISCKHHATCVSIESGLQPKYALLIIDMQKDFIDSDGRYQVEASQGERTLKSINEILSEIDTNTVEIIYIGNEFALNDENNKDRNFSAIQGSDGAKLSSKLMLVNHIYFSKNQGDAFTNMRFDQYLRAHSINNLILTGVYADHCILSTIKGALDRKYSVFAVPEAVASSDKEHYDKAINQYRKNGVNLLSPDQVIRILNER